MKSRKQIKKDLERAGKNADYITGYLRGWDQMDKRIQKEQEKKREK